MATQYINYGLGGSGSGGVTSLTLTAFGSSPNADGASLTGQALTLQPADATHPGGVSTTTQSFAGNKTFLDNLLANVIDAEALTGTMSIGGTNASIINIGNSGATVNIQGTTLYENVTQLQVTDPLITLNKGGGAGSAANSGFEIEENSLITGYVETSGDRNSWLLKAPNTAGIATITPGSSGITINQSSHDPVTLTAVGSSPNANGASLSSQALTLQPADNTNPGVITASTQTIGGDKTFSGQTILGDPGTESTGININGATFQSTLKVSDIDGTNFAQTILHRHSTVLEPLIVGARSNSNTSSHGNIAADQTVFSIYGTGWETDNYKIFGSLNITASTLGSLSSTSSPGKITINTTPNSATSPTAHLTLDSDKSSTFAGTVSATGVNISGLTASYAVVTDSSKNLASLQYTNANTASTLVQRDSSGNFSAGTITATLNGNATNVTGTVAIGNGGTGQTSKAAAFDALSPMSAGGDIIYGGASGTGTRLANGSSGQVLTSSGGTSAPTWTSLLNDSYDIRNLTITTSVNGNALTVAVKTQAGTDASATDPIKISFRSSTLTSGVFNTRTITGSLSLTVSSGSTLGQKSGVPWVQYIYLIDNAGTPELAISASLYNENSLRSTTAEGGAGAADSITTIYSTTSRSSLPIRLIGTLLNTQNPTGTWTSAGTKLQVGAYGSLISNGEMTITTKTSGSGTYYPPAGVVRLRIKMIGGGGGGGATGTTGSPTSGSNGNDTTFGTCTASKGVGGPLGTGGGSSGAGTGGGTTIGSGWSGMTVTGGSGTVGSNQTGYIAIGGSGGNGFLGGGGSGGSSSTAAQGGAANTGAGGGGGGAITGCSSGAGGGAGGYIDAVTSSGSSAWASSFSYSVGAGGAAGSVGGGDGLAGAAGGAGYIVIEEYYK